MDLLNQGESSGGPSIQPEKRRRGRPRKDPSLKHAGAVHLPPGFEGVKENLPQRADRTFGIDYMVGQAVSGVIEATFDAGYLLAVRIGNSNINLRGVVFKPGHYVPITAENDVAPHVQMIRRNNIHLTAQNQGWSQGQNRATQTAAKRKYAPPKTAPSVPPVGVSSTVTPVVHQPSSSDLQTSSNGDKDVHVVEPLSMLPPEQSMPISQIFVATQPELSHQVAPGSEEDDNTKPLTSSTDTDTTGSSQTSDTKIEGTKELLISSVEDSGIVSKQEIGLTNEPFSTEATPPVLKPLFNYGTGRMTELLQALQENMKENQATTTEPDPKNQANLP